MYRLQTSSIKHRISYSDNSAAASSSTIQRTFPFTSAAGTDPSRGASFNIFAVISAFPDPMATKIFYLAALTTGKENVTRSGGGFGESAMGKIHPSSRFKSS